MIVPNNNKLLMFRILSAIIITGVCCAGIYIFLLHDTKPLTCRQVAGDTDSYQKDHHKSNEAITEKPGPQKQQDNQVNASAKQESEVLYRVFGEIRDVHNEPLPNIPVCWLPLRKSALMHHRNDGRLLGSMPHSVRFMNNRIQKALKELRKMKSTEDGMYELLIPCRNTIGVVMTGGDTHEIIIISIQEKDISTIESVNNIVGEVEINFTLQPAGSISGTVTVEDTGEPAEGVVVYADCIKRDVPSHNFIIKPYAPSAMVGENGTYMLKGLPLNAYHVFPAPSRGNYVVTSEEEGTLVDLLNSTKVTDIDFKVKSGCTVYGIVTSAEREPIPEAAIAMQLKDSLANQVPKAIITQIIIDKKFKKTSSEGFYKFQGLLPNFKYRLVAKKEGYTDTVSNTFQITEEMKDMELNLSMDSGWSVSGQLLFSNREPVSGKQVHLIQQDTQRSDRTRFYDTTNKNGNFEFSGVPLGAYVFISGKILPNHSIKSNESIGEVIIDGSGDITELEFVIDQQTGNTISGVIIDDNGVPVENASLRVYSKTNVISSSKYLKSDSEGRFLVQGVKDKLVTIAARKSGYSETVIENVKSDSKELTIVLNRFAEISGSVIVPNNAAIGDEGYVVPVVKKEKRGEETGVFTYMKNLKEPVSEDGSFHLEVPEGTLQLLVCIPRYAYSWSNEMQVRPAEKLTGVTIEVTKGATAYGRVVLSDNTPIENATVRFTRLCSANEFGKRLNNKSTFSGYETFATTDHEGVYETPYLAAGEYTITACRDGLAPSAPATAVLTNFEFCKIPTIVLLRESVIKGIVVENGKPKERVRIQLSANGVSEESITKPDGIFEFRGLKKDTYFLSFDPVRDHQNNCKRTRTITLKEEEDVNLKIVFGDGYRIQGRIQNIPLDSINSVSLHQLVYKETKEKDSTNQPIRTKNEPLIGKVKIRSDGTYEFNDVEPGHYILKLWNKSNNILQSGENKIVVENDAIEVSTPVKN